MGVPEAAAGIIPRRLGAVAFEYTWNVYTARRPLDLNDGMAGVSLTSSREAVRGN